LTVSDTMTSGDTLNALAYTPGDLVDVDGNTLDAYSGQSITNNAPVGGPTFTEILSDTFLGNPTEQTLDVYDPNWSVLFTEGTPDVRVWDSHFIPEVDGLRLTGTGTNFDDHAWSHATAVANDQYSRLAFVDLTRNGTNIIRWGHGIRLSNDGSGLDGYIVRTTMSTGNWATNLERWDNGSATTLGSPTDLGSTTLSADYETRIYAIGTTITAEYWDGSAWVQIASVTDATYASGAVGIYHYQQSSLEIVVVKNWSAGMVASGAAGSYVKPVWVAASGPHGGTTDSAPYTWTSGSFTIPAGKALIALGGDVRDLPTTVEFAGSPCSLVTANAKTAEAIIENGSDLDTAKVQIWEIDLASKTTGTIVASQSIASTLGRQLAFNVWGGGADLQFTDIGISEGVGDGVSDDIVTNLETLDGDDAIGAIFIRGDFNDALSEDANFTELAATQPSRGWAIEAIGLPAGNPLVITNTISGSVDQLAEEEYAVVILGMRSA